MTQEDKDLLKKVICEMLPWGVNLYHPDDYGDNIGKLESINISNDECVIWNYNGTDTDIFDIEVCKPYLRPMSSMTKEELNELENVASLSLYDSRDSEVLSGKTITNGTDIDWLNSHHFDYRGLIPMGMALPAPEDMYNKNSK